MAIGITIELSINATAQQPNIPSWIKNTAKWWGEGQISDDEFIKAIQYLIDQKILIVSSNAATSLQNVNPTTSQQNNAIQVNQKIAKGHFEVSVIKVGPYVNNNYGNKETDFRVDWQAQNIGTQADYFIPQNMVILDNQGNQYDFVEVDSLDIGSTIYPGITKSGYVLFKGLPTGTNNIKFEFQLGYDENYHEYQFEYDISLIK